LKRFRDEVLFDQDVREWAGNDVSCNSHITNAWLQVVINDVVFAIIVIRKTEGKLFNGIGSKLSKYLIGMTCSLGVKYG
jgi:hypothetical protein